MVPGCADTSPVLTECVCLPLPLLHPPAPFHHLLSALPAPSFAIKTRVSCPSMFLRLSVSLARAHTHTHTHTHKHTHTHYTHTLHTHTHYTHTHTHTHKLHTHTHTHMRTRTRRETERERVLCDWKVVLAYGNYGNFVGEEMRLGCVR